MRSAGIEIPEIPLPGGGAIPQLGLGTWQMQGRECEHAVRAALDLGYTHFDTAEVYRNEGDVGRAIRGADRARLFITSKVWRSRLRPDDLRIACEKSLNALATEYLDLLLVHWPNSDIPIAETIEGFRALRDDGRIRAWGVSNFTARHLREAVRHGTPATNQVELHPFFHQADLVDLCRELRIPVTAYSPLAKGRVLDDERLLRISRAHDASPAQVALRWAARHGHIVIPKAADENHLRDNLEAFALELSEDEILAIDDLPQGERLVDGDWSEFDR